jgi:hypothetical protein
MPLTVDELEEGFKTYFAEMERCLRHECYWALLHIVVVLPDICAALETKNGQTSGELYQRWCSSYWPSKRLSPEQRWSIRCALLHQGRAVLRTGESLSYIRPAPPGSRVHEYLDPTEKNITLEVDKLAAEVRKAIHAWASDLQKNRVNPTKLNNVRRHMRWLAKEKPKTLPPGLIPPGSTTFPTTSST